MLKVELITGTIGGHVAWVWIPPFLTLPPVLIWGTRTFRLKDEDQAQLYARAETYQVEYEEVFAYYVPPGFDEIDNRYVPEECR